MRNKLAILLLSLATLVAHAQMVEESFARDTGPLDFVKGEGYEQAILQALTGDALVGLDAAGKVVPRLAASWKAKDGTFLFRLRKDARFTDGSPAEAEDAVWTLQAIQADPKASPTKRAILEGARVELKDGQVAIQSPMAPGRLLMALARIPIAQRGHPDRGTGPFLLRHDGGEWRLLRRDHFLKPTIEGLHFRILGDSQAVAQALQKGWLSIGVPPARLQSQPPQGYRVVTQPMTYQLVVWSRMGLAPLQAMERWRKDAFPPQLLGAGARPSRGLWPGVLGFEDHDIDAATVPLPKGQPLPLLYAAGDEPVEKLLMALRERARRDGIPIDLQPVDPALLAARLQKGDFQLACYLATFDPEPWSVLEYMEPHGPLNLTGWSSPALARIVSRLKDPGDAAWTDLQNLWAKAPGALPLVDFHSIVWVDKRLQVTPGLLGLYLSTPGAAGWRWEK